MKTFQVTVIRLADGGSFMSHVQARDEWNARTMIMFKTPRGWANGSELSYKITEVK